MGLTQKRQHVVLAHAVETNVADQHHLIARFSKELA